MKKILVLAAALCAGVVSCKKTAVTGGDSGVASTGSAPGAGGAAGGGAAGGGSATTPTAAGGEVTGLKAVSDCPKSLAGSEEVARVIKKECGPIPVTGDYSVEGSLTLEAGAQLKLAESTELSIGYNKPAKLIVKGTPQDPVVLTGSGDPVPGFWKGVRLYRNAARSQIQGLVIENAGGDDRGALLVGAQDVGVKATTIRNAKEVGVRFENDVVPADFSGNVFEKAGAMAMSVQAQALSGLGAGNKFDADAVIEVRGGDVQKSGKWQNPGAPYFFTADTSIDGKNSVKTTIEIQPGTELRFGSGVELSVGYNQAAGLVAAGAPDKPIVFTSGSEKAPGSWDGVMIYRHGEGRFENAVFEHGGGNEDRGALLVQIEAPASVKGCTFKGNRVAMVVENGARLKELATSKFSGSEKRSLAIGPNELGVVAADNTFDQGERVEVRAGEVDQSQTWNALATTVEVEGDISAEKRAVLTLAPGVDLRFREGAGLTVGYNDESSLRAAGTADKPIRLRGTREEPGSWDGVSIYLHAHDVVLENVMVDFAGGDAGVNVHGEASAKITNLTCTKCSGPALKWDCPSKVTSTGVKAGEGTPAAEAKPEGC